MSKPLKISNINFNEISLSNIVEKNNRKIIRLSYNNRRFLIQTPDLLYKKNIIQNKNIYELNIPLYCNDKSKNSELLNFFRDFDKFLVEKGKENSSIWFKNAKSTKIRYKSIIRQANSDNEIFSNGVFKLKMKNDNNIKITNEMDSCELDDLSEISLYKTKIVFEPYAIWVSDIGFGLYIKPVLLDFSIIEEVTFLEDSEDDICDILDTEIENTIINQSEVLETMNKLDENVEEEKNDLTSDDDVCNLTIDDIKESDVLNSAN